MQGMQNTMGGMGMDPYAYRMMYDQWGNNSMGMQMQGGQNGQNMMYGQQSQMQQQQVRTPSYFLGRFVQSPEEIMAAEIPMDVPLAIFPLVDGKTIITKRWNQDGKLEPRVYVLQDDETAETQKSEDPLAEFMEAVNGRFDNIEKLIKKNNRPYYQNNQKKKEDQK